MAGTSFNPSLYTINAPGGYFIRLGSAAYTGGGSYNTGQILATVCKQYTWNVANGTLGYWSAASNWSWNNGATPGSAVATDAANFNATGSQYNQTRVYIDQTPANSIDTMNIQGAGYLAIGGPGVLTMSNGAYIGANGAGPTVTYTIDTTGSLTLSSTAAAGITINGGTLLVNGGTIASTYSGYGGATVNVDNGGTLAGVNGTVSMSGGTCAVNLGNGGTLAGTLNLTGELLSNGGYVNPGENGTATSGTPGTITINGWASLTNTVLDLDLGSGPSNLVQMTGNSRARISTAASSSTSAPCPGLAWAGWARIR